MIELNRVRSVAVSSHVLKCNLSGIWKCDPDSVSVSYKVGSLEDDNIWLFGRAEKRIDN